MSIHKKSSKYPEGGLRGVKRTILSGHPTPLYGEFTTELIQNSR